MARFRYATIAEVRRQSIRPWRLDDSRVLELIEYVSDLINAITTQWFQPLYMSKRVSGSGSRIASFPNLIPIIDMTKLELVSGSGTNETSLEIESGNYQVGKHWVELGSLSYGSMLGFGGAKSGTTILGSTFSSRRKFREGLNNIRLTGYFGWIANERAELDKEVSTTIAEGLSTNSTSVTVADVSDLEIGDACLIGKSVNIIIDDIQTSTKTVYFNPSSGTASNGAEFKTWGRVPRLINRATMILVEKNRRGIGTDEFQRKQFESRIIRERTDKYEYELAEQGVGVGINSTGDIDADRILDQIMARIPTYVGYV